MCCNWRDHATRWWITAEIEGLPGTSEGMEVVLVSYSGILRASPPPDRVELAGLQVR